MRVRKKEKGREGTGNDGRGWNRDGRGWDRDRRG